MREKKPEVSRSLRSLGFHKIALALAGRAKTPGGKEAAAAASFAPDLQAAQRLLDETAAMISLLERRPDFDIEPCQDITGLLSKAGKSVVLTGLELLAFVPILRTGQRLNTIFEAESGEDVALARVHLPAVHGLMELIVESIDDEGQVRPDATPEIERLSKNLTSLRGTIRDRAEKMLRDPDIAPMLQDNYVTLRDNRFVLPIKAERQSHLKGIIHDSSNSGQTFYIEPKELVDLNNKLRTVEMELADEIVKLLADLSAMVASEAEAIEEIYSGLCHLDYITARARFANDYNFTRPVFSDRLALKGAAHPIMLLEKKNVVRNDISIPQGARALIISGPNTGGKTVSLAIVGLAALMAKTGLYIPALEGSCIPFYHDVLADIGDSQSITDDLSTFSGHLKSINDIVRQAGPGSLALLDELMINTDPKEGSALALSVVESLVSSQTDVIVTTHFSELKIFAQTQPLYHNVSMEFDTAAARPTYQMIEGAPGESSALAVAEKLELAPSIVTAARALLEGGGERVEKMLAGLRDQKKMIDRERRETQSALGEAQRARREVVEAREEIEKNRAERARTAKRKLSGEIAAARKTINALLEEANGAKGSKAGLKRSLEKLESISSEIRSAAAPAERIARDKLRSGDEVFIVPLEQRGVLTRDPAAGKADVAMGSIRLTVNLSDLIGVKVGSHATGGTVKPAVFTSTTYTSADVGNELNIRGMRVDEAIGRVEKFLDTAFGGDQFRLRIVHGKGTGALRLALHEYLDSSPYISDYKTAEQNKGGEGATDVILRKE